MMRKFILVMTVLLFCSIGTYAGQEAEEDSIKEKIAINMHVSNKEDSLKVTEVKGTSKWENVINAIMKVESNDKENAKNGNCVGVLQIAPVLVTEVNNILKSRRSSKRYKLADRKSISKSKEMFEIFQSKYNPAKNIERAIRMWNGGIKYSVGKTQRYYNKVMKYLN